MSEDERLRMLVVGPYPPPFGGIASHIEELARNTDQLGVSLDVLRFASRDADDEHPHPDTTVLTSSTRRASHVARALIGNPMKGLRVLALVSKAWGGNPRVHASGLFRAVAIADMVDRRKRDVVALYGTTQGAAIPYLRVLCPDLPIIYWVFAAPYIRPGSFERSRQLYRSAVESSDRLVATSKYCAGAVDILAGVTREDVEVIYFGVDGSRFASAVPRGDARRRLGIPESETKKVVLFLGRMEPEMGAGNALEIARYISGSSHNVTFLICGAGGPLREEVEQAAATSEGRIISKFNVPYDEVPSLYAASDLVIAPTVGAHACMGVTVKEAMAAGRPSVVSGSGGLPEAIKDGIHGRIIPLAASGSVDNEAFAAAVVKLLDDPDTLATMGSNSRTRFEELFTTDMMLKKIKRLAQEAIDAHSGPA